jgi:hypothetical protein
MVSTWMAVPLTPSVVRRLSLVLVVIQASGVAAPTGAANATLTTTASTLCFIQYVSFMIFLLCLSETFWQTQVRELIRIEILRRAYPVKPFL